VLLTSTARRLRSLARLRRPRSDAAARSRQGARDLAMATQAAFVRYRPSPYRGAVTLLVTPVSGAKAGRRVAEEWGPYLAGAEIVDVEGAHSGAGSLLDEPFVARTAEVVATALAG
jgi:thioesterase domain-containing protein